MNNKLFNRQPNETDPDFWDGCMYDNWEDYSRAVEDQDREDEEYREGIRHYDPWD